MFNYSTSKALLSDFQNNNFNHFIQNKKSVLYLKMGISSKIYDRKLTLTLNIL